MVEYVLIIVCIIFLALEIILFFMMNSDMGFWIGRCKSLETKIVNEAESYKEQLRAVREELKEIRESLEGKVGK